LTLRTSAQTTNIQESTFKEFYGKPVSFVRVGTWNLGSTSSWTNNAGDKTQEEQPDIMNLIRMEGAGREQMRLSLKFRN